jgi:hypothetical protein
MILLGVEFSSMTCSISAVSEHYTFLGHNYFEYNNKVQLEAWIQSIILNDCEQIKWFFCENSYLLNDYHYSFFIPSTVLYSVYLVKDRVVKDFYHTICDFDYACNRSTVELSIILAMSFRLFDPQFIRLYSNSEQLYMW